MNSIYDITKYTYLLIISNDKRIKLNIILFNDIKNKDIFSIEDRVEAFEFTIEPEYIPVEFDPEGYGYINASKNCTHNRMRILFDKVLYCEFINFLLTYKKNIDFESFEFNNLFSLFIDYVDCFIFKESYVKSDCSNNPSKYTLRRDYSNLGFTHRDEVKGFNSIEELLEYYYYDKYPSKYILTMNDKDYDFYIPFIGEVSEFLKKLYVCIDNYDNIKYDDFCIKFLILLFNNLKRQKQEYSELIRFKYPDDTFLYSIEDYL